MIFDYSEAKGRSTLLRSGMAALREKGLGFVLPLAIRWATFPLWRWTRRARTFEFGGLTFPYFLHNYNITWANERAVEVPIARHFLTAAAGKRVLEAGNVLSRYLPVSHTIVDRYDPRPDVRNLDLAGDDLGGEYDLIVAISTLEHVGWDETPKERGKVAQAVENLQRHLAPGGTLLVTAPLGYNAELDRLVDSGGIRFDEIVFMKKVSASNEWTTVPRDETVGCRYNDRWPGASAILIGISRKLALSLHEQDRL